LHFKKIGFGRFAGLFTGAGVNIPEGVLWFWIGSHADYDNLVGWTLGRNWP
jgi:hypothetical protein